MEFIIGHIIDLNSGFMFFEKMSSTVLSENPNVLETSSEIILHK
jgi:hypothetical protein